MAVLRSTEGGGYPDAEPGPRARRALSSVHPVLVARTQNGDARAFRELVTRFQDLAVASACAHLGTLEGAREAARDAFLDAHGRIQEVRDAERVPRFLGDAVERRCAAEPGAAAPLAADAAMELLARVAGLPRHQERAAVLLFGLAGASDEEAGRFLGLPASTVHARLDAATRRLKKRTVRALQRELSAARPSLDDAFVEGVMRALA
jgi:DNA-directed RNA polymerase specialized sigma24 family protein